MTSLGSLEQAIMTVLWEEAPAGGRGLTVREVLDRLTDRDPAYTTVMTVLTRLAAKGLTERTRDGRAWRYTPVRTRESLTAQAMRSPLDDLSHEERHSAILHFLDDATPAELASLREAMAHVEARAAEQAAERAEREARPRRRRLTGKRPA